MLLEATRVLEEGIVREPGDVDMGLILGIGFPPFRGGILRWCDSVGAARSSKNWRSTRTLASGLSRPSRCCGWRKRARRFIRGPSWLRVEVRQAFQPDTRQYQAGKPEVTNILSGWKA